jgi:predicted dienelactone hydrolase
MKRILLLLVLLCSSTTVLAAAFDSATGTFNDASRNRKIPYKIYFPDPLDKQYPVIIVSHGLGGSRDGDQILGKHLASHGFICIHIQHLGSDDSIYQGARSRQEVQLGVQKAQSPAAAVNRFLDVPFVVGQLPKLNESDERLKGHLNLQSIGMAGHSYGSISVMVAAGERMGDRYQSFKVPTIRAGLSLSPSPPHRGLDPARAYADVTIPIFHMTGTEDVNLVERSDDVLPKDRIVPYQTLTIPNQYLLVLHKADHMTFSGRRIRTGEEKKLDKQHMTVVLNGALAFFEAYLSDSKSAEKWLREEYKKTLDAQDAFEFK